MQKITETDRWKYWEDEIAKNEYERSQCFYSVHITPKERKIKFLSSLKGWPEKDLCKLKSKQLSKIANMIEENTYIELNN